MKAMTHYDTARADARAHAKRMFDYHKGEMERHQAYLDAESARDEYLLQEGLLSGKTNSASNSQNEVQPQLKIAEERYGVPLGNKEKEYEKASIAIFKENAEADISMYLNYFEKNTDLPVNHGGIKGFIGRAKRDGRLAKGKYGFVVPGPNFSKMLDEKSVQKKNGTTVGTGY